MARTGEITALTSSVLLRLFSYIFFRWIPGDLFPQLLGTSFAIYCTSWIYVVLTTPPYDVVDEKVDVVVKPIEYGTGSDSTSNGVPAEEIDVEDTIITKSKPPHPLLTLLTGVPSTSMFASLTSFAVNVVLFLFMIDATYRAALFHTLEDFSFARLGYVSENSAKILVREPNITRLPIFLSYRYADVPVIKTSGAHFDSSWRHSSSVVDLSEETDFTAVMTIEGLRPDTRYQYALSNNYTSYFITAPPPGSVSRRGLIPDETVIRSDETNRGGTFTFLHSSCIKTRFPYNPLDHPLTIPGMRPLAKAFSKLNPAFFLFLGDFIYVDVPRRHGVDVSNYRREYRQVYASPEWPLGARVLQDPLYPDQTDYDLPWIHVYDDHEISNDWSANTTGVFPAALDPYTHYHISGNPPPSEYAERNGLFSRRTSLSPVHTQTYTTFIQGPSSFFLMDTRRYRSEPCSSSDETCDATMLGEAQRKSLLSWLAAPPSNPGVRWKILVSSVPFTRNWRVNAKDTWGGYLSERRQVLEAIWAAGSDGSGTGVIILSGDRHEHATTAFPPPPRLENDLGARVGEAAAVEFSTSPLSMFYLPWRTYREDPPKLSSTGDYYVGHERETCLKYHPEGNSKFGAIRIESPKGSGQSLLRYMLYVDGQEVWSHVLVAPERRRGAIGKWKEGAWE
ncbi:MAG: hypothetical protein Q9162_000407 [Coniocarpon cinnabarinum]